MSHPRSLATLLTGLLLWVPWTAQAQDAPPDIQDLQRLEKTLRNLAEASIPKTVLVKAIVQGNRAGAGSGAIISPDGYILTCSHVVEIGHKLEVTTPDGTVYEAKLLGRNKRQDYALIKIEAQGLPAFTIGDSSTVALGDWVVALGHPGGPYEDVQPAFAAGRVRGLDRKLPVGMMRKYYNHAIMTDVPIFAGDSGGPLIDAEGLLVGINGAIVMINEMAFAIPINQILADMDALKAGDTLEGEKAGPEAWKQMQDIISPEDYQRMMQRSMKNFGKMFGGDSPFGKLFEENGPLSELFGGGNGEMPDLSEMFGEDSPLSQLFGGENGDLQEMLEKMLGGGNGEMPDLQKMMEQLFGGGGGGEAPDLGKIFEDMFGGRENPFGDLFGGGRDRPPEPPAAKGPARPFLGVRAAQNQAGANGVLVDMIVEKGPAAAGGLKKGDVILSVDGRATPDIGGLRNVIAPKKPGDTIEVRVRRTEFVDTVLVENEKTFEITLGSR